MNWEQSYCPNHYCAREAWMVQRIPITHDVWCVAEHEDDFRFTVAAQDPVCPHCGTMLLTTVELAGALAVGSHAEARSVFDFVPSLA